MAVAWPGEPSVPAAATRRAGLQVSVEMHKRGRWWGLGLVPLIGALALASIGHRLVASSDPSALAKKAAIAVGELRSLSAEGRLLAEAGLHGDVTSVFLREHAAQIAKDLRPPLRQLQRREGQLPEAWTAAATGSATRSLAALEEMAGSAEARLSQQHAAATLAASASELSRLERSLEQRAK